MTQIIRVSSAEIRAVFTTWLATQVGVRLVILEGLSGVGKSWLTREPFISDGWAVKQSRLTIFVKIRSVPKATSAQLIERHLKPQSMRRSFPY